MIKRRELVVRGCDDDAAESADAGHFARRPAGIGADRQGVTHRQDQLERIGWHVRHFHDVRGQERCAFGTRSHTRELLAHLLDHRRRVVDEMNVEAALKQLESPLAGAASEVGAARRHFPRQPGLDRLPGEFIVKMPVRVIVDRVVLPRDTIVISAGAVSVPCHRAKYRPR